jgi:hypothetical protein
MPDPETFDKTLEVLASYSEDLGDEVYEKSIPNVLEVTIQDQEYSLTGNRCLREDNRYIIAGHPDLRFVSAVYLLSIKNNLASDLDLDTAEAIAGEDNGDEKETRREAAEKLLDQIPRSDMNSFRSYCYQFISGASHETTFINNDSGSLLLFVVSRDIFPYEDSFGISDFSEAVRSVVSMGERGNRLVGRTLFLDVDEDRPEDSEVKSNFSW